MIGFKDVLLFSVFRDTAHCVVVDADAEERRDILRISEDELLKPTRHGSRRAYSSACLSEILTDVLKTVHEHNTHRLRPATFEMIHAAWSKILHDQFF
jgi:hypothetical protein